LSDRFRLANSGPNPEAIANIDSIVKNLKPNIAAERKRLTVPADLAESAKLAVRYHNAALGDIGVIRAGASTSFDFGAWTSEVATRKNDDGTLSYVTNGYIIIDSIDSTGGNITNGGGIVGSGRTCH
jgi:hypothetical protein